MIRHFFSLLSIAFLSCGCFFFTAAQAEVVISEPELLLEEALTRLSRDMNLKLFINIDDHLKQKRIAKSLKGEPYDILATLSKVYDFDWYTYGSILSIESGSEYNNYMFRLSNISTETLETEFYKYFKFNEQMSLTILDKGTSVMLSGTKRFINDAVSFSRTLDGNQFVKSGNQLEVAKIEFNHLPVNDRALASFGQSVTFPGAKAIIELILSNIGQFDNLDDKKALEKAYRLNLNQKDRQQLDENDKTYKVEALPGANALIVRGTPAEVKLAKRISLLIDVKKQALIFNVKVYDVVMDRAEVMGVSSAWMDPQKGISEIVTPPLEDTEEFLKNLDILYVSGLARSVYETNILSMENQEGYFGKSESVYNKIESHKTSTLEKITADNSLYVTGRVIPSGDVIANIRYIEETLSAATGGDGSGGGFPRVGSQSVNTEINIAKNTTVILGGFSKSETDKQETGIPVISSIPIIGSLFKRTSITKRRFKRYISVSFNVVD